jgi:hypothetical protein
VSCEPRGQFELEPHAEALGANVYVGGLEATIERFPATVRGLDVALARS